MNSYRCERLATLSTEVVSQTRRKRILQTILKLYASGKIRLFFGATQKFKKLVYAEAVSKDGKIYITTARQFNSYAKIKENFVLIVFNKDICGESFKKHWKLDERKIISLSNLHSLWWNEIKGNKYKSCTIEVALSVAGYTDEYIGKAVAIKHLSNWLIHQIAEEL